MGLFISASQVEHPPCSVAVKIHCLEMEHARRNSSESVSESWKNAC